MFAVVVRFKIAPGQVEAFRPLMLENAAASRAEPGCHQFDVCFDPARPEEVFLYELYTDEAAFQAHLQTAHFAKVNAATEGMVEEKVIRTYAEVVA